MAVPPSVRLLTGHWDSSCHRPSVDQTLFAPRVTNALGTFTVHQGALSEYVAHSELRRRRGGCESWNDRGAGLRRHWGRALGPDLGMPILSPPEDGFIKWIGMGATFNLGGSTLM
jgi:hypothetical protein